MPHKIAEATLFIGAIAIVVWRAWIGASSGSEWQQLASQMQECNQALW